MTADAVRPARRLPHGRLGRAATLALAGVFANLLSYVLLVAAAAVLAPRGYSQLVAVHGVLLVASVPAVAVQTVAARRTAVGDSAGLRAATLRVAVVATAATLLLAVPVERFARLPNLGPLLAVTVAVPGLVALGLAQGVLQGRRRFGTLAGIGAASAVARSGGGVVGLVAGHSAVASLAATAGCLTLLAVAVWVAVVLPALPHPVSAAGGLGGAVREAVHATHAHGVFYGLTALDLLLARHVLPPGQAAVYAAGAVLARAALWLPASVAVLAFPALTDPARRRTVLPAAAALVAGAGTVLTLGVLVLSGTAARLVGSGKYPQLADSAWAFALLGTAAAVLQLAVAAGLATRSMLPVTLTWGAAVAETVLVLVRGSAGTVTSVVGSCAGAVALAAVVAVLLQLRTPSSPVRGVPGVGSPAGSHR